jgi:TolB protein
VSKESQLCFSKRCLFKGLVAGALAGASLPLMAQLQVDILGVGSNQFPIAIQNFGGSTEQGALIASVIRGDLIRSGAFRITGVESGVSAFDTAPNWNQLKADGAEADVVGDVIETPDKRYQIRFKLFDVVKGQESDQMTCIAPAADLRLIAHRIADRIYEKITGEKGAFASRIAYVSQSGPKKYNIMVADSDGFNPQSALGSREPIISVAWSPNGRQIAYTTFETGKPTVFIQDLSNGKRRQVAAFRGNNSAPAFSPDGQTLAVALSKDGHTQIYLINTDGTGLRRFTSSSGIDTEPAFSPDGRYIYFTSDRGGNPQIYRQPVAGGAAERVSFGSNYAVSPDVSPKGNQVAYIVRQDGHFQLVQQDLATGAVIPLSQVGRNESPSYAPNGNMIIYASDVGGKGVLSTVSTDGATRSRLSGLSGNIREPAWGPILK